MGEAPYVFTRRFPDLWLQVKSEFKHAVSVHNTEMKATLVTVQIAAGETISIRKPTFPAAYLDVRTPIPAPTASTSSSIAPTRLLRGRRKKRVLSRLSGRPVMVWKGRHRTAAEFADDMVRRFFEGM